jgi:hypothetical protein
MLRWILQQNFKSGLHAAGETTRDLTGRERAELCVLGIAALWRYELPPALAEGDSQWKRR